MSIHSHFKCVSVSLFIVSFADSTANILQNDQLFVLIMMKMCMMPLFPHQKLYVEYFTACQQTRIYYDLSLLWITCSLCDTIYVLLFSVKLTAAMSISCLWQITIEMTILSKENA